MSRAPPPSQTWPNADDADAAAAATVCIMHEPAAAGKIHLRY